MENILTVLANPAVIIGLIGAAAVIIAALRTKEPELEELPPAPRWSRGGPIPFHPNCRSVLTPLSSTELESAWPTRAELRAAALERTQADPGREPHARRYTLPK